MTFPKEDCHETASLLTHKSSDKVGVVQGDGTVCVFDSATQALVYKGQLTQPRPLVLMPFHLLCFDQRRLEPLAAWK